MNVVEDRRIGGALQRIMLPEGIPIMRVPDEIRNCVGFISYQSASGRPVVGTFFFVYDPLEPQLDAAFIYLVTAKHVITNIQSKSVDGFAYLRINTADGGVSDLATRCADWLVDTDVMANSDVAVLPWSAPPGLYQFKAVPRTMFLSTETLASEGIGVGDDVFLTGLFVNHYGKQRNVPIVRVGTIAAMPEEPIQTLVGDMEAYLVEARSIGGLSGSPVFVYLNMIRLNPTQKETDILKGDRFYLLGLMHGHWRVRVAQDSGLSDSVDEEAVNMGIAIVVPAQRIQDILNKPELVLDRELQANQLRQQRLPVPDTALGDS